MGNEEDTPDAKLQCSSPPPRWRPSYLAVSSVIWLAISIYPVFVFFFNQPAMAPFHERLHDSVHPAPAGQIVTRTRTVAIGSFPATPLHGALNMEKPENAHRLTDALDTFEDFHKLDRCKLSSLDLHGPFEPLCQDKESLLQAMSGGGRIGFDAPFSPKGCDMRWFSPTEICAVLSKFSEVHILGDSMMRNLAVAMHVFLRADLVNGGRTDWQNDPRGYDCRCEGVFDFRPCTFNAVASTRMAHRFSPGSVVCTQGESANIEYHNLLEYPIRQPDLDVYLGFLPLKRPPKPVAFVMGHGLWNDLDHHLTYGWIDQAMSATKKAAPWLERDGGVFPRLFLTPSAAGDRKPDLFVARQGNIALTRFEKTVGEWVRSRGIDHLGTYNMSIQANNPDGTHGGMKVNLIKAMMVFNWLNAIATLTE